MAAGVVVGMGAASAKTTNDANSSSQSSASATANKKGGNNNGDSNGGNNGDNNNGKAEDPAKAQPPSPNDFVDITKVKPNQKKQNGAGGSFVTDCGVKANHQNSDNFIAAPGVLDGAQHTHDYVGNDSTDANSTDDSLAAAGTTCKNQQDKSAYFWPVIRDLTKQGNDVNQDGGGADGNFGQILEPDSVQLKFASGGADQVTAMPQFLRILFGNAKAVTQNGKNAKDTWTCTGFEDRLTNKYPLCPQGSKVERIHAFPNCWDGKNTDSADHRSHIVDAQNGQCPKGFKAVPQLQVTLTYTVPQGKNFAVDGFPEELHKPQTDHDDFENVMSNNLMKQVVDCINNNKQCVNQEQ
ncbi:DUF1996 domain-containing protein [Gandjariella thermophila]|uniref:DUF1996 domain-containing protein n=1 Tax=Gandjariella thermophila TaxID=1931992 RepID=UPI001CEF9B81|nr:DUF1996 domain-containing protein [Gandjariella thermophila]